MADKKVAFITGSGKRRVGNVVAHWLAQAGYSVVIHYRSSETAAMETAAELKEFGVDVLTVAADLTDEVQVDRAFDQALAKFGRLDALVCAAATWGKGSIEAATARQVRREWEINTLGTYLCCRRAGLQMVSQPEGGCIVTIGDWAIARPYLDHVAYFVSKGALPTMTRTLAVELAARNPNVRVNCVMPGPVMIPDDMPAEERKAAIDATLVKREGRPENVAHAVRFLIENDFVTGVCLPVDGGRSVYAGGD